MKPEIPTSSPRRILLVEDETDIADLVALHLGDVCDEVVIARDGYEWSCPGFVDGYGFGRAGGSWLLS